MENTKVAERKTNYITDDVLPRIRTKIARGEITLPSGYSAENSVSAAYLILKQMTVDKTPVLEACTKESIANAILEMVTQGLNPMKQQCYFIPFKDKDLGVTKLTLFRSYFGTIAITKRVPGVVDVVANVVYENDKFELGFDIIRGVQTIEVFKPAPDHENKRIIGAFAAVIGTNGILRLEYMSMSDIRKSWNQGQMKGGSPAHKNFEGEMAKRTVINRACKMYAKTSDDSSHFSSILAKEPVFDIDAEMHEHEEVVAETVEVEAVSEATGEIPEAPQGLEF